ncbi:acetate--CoA ligase [Nguyenibacter vanlangensis]|uniref:Acetate--CoA ligase n=1 Tax=Nguyenibacter vanlangensis TaxID=1216886 RepID=A0A7Y7M5G0_9PROT|nr:acetate--CoA ligase [Nguyenibacter vanlangensis]NVN10987.1 acetate--CoA ligase [Nguyenibacter vanlangensis]
MIFPPVSTLHEHRAHRKAAHDDPERYWLTYAHALDWMQCPSKALDAAGLWFPDGRLNASVNCLDRHLEMRGNATALIWQGEEESHVLHLSYRQLHAQVCRMANVLRDHGIMPGDRVAIHLPGVPEGVVAMLACARIGAIHVVLFGGFSPEAIADRLADSGAGVIITADVGRRGAKRIPFKATIDAALDHGAGTAIRHVLVVAVTSETVPMTEGRDRFLSPLLSAASDLCTPEPMDANAPLFLLYTSGSTGKPKGIVHGTGGYLLWAAYTHALVFAHTPGDIFWCTADIGWITGHSYVVYGPLANGGTILLFEGMPSHPRPGRWWQVIEKHRVTSFYTSPTAIRALMTEGDTIPKRYDLFSLRVLGSVGEPISQEAWGWFHATIGGGRCPLADTWWQTETGGIMISLVPGAIEARPGAAAFPLPGVTALLLDASGRILEGEAEGMLCIAGSWPGRALGIWGNDAHFHATYLRPFPGYYFTGDGARRDRDGYFWLTGRVDDVINVSGHRIGSAEVEDALAMEPAIAECAAVGVPHALKGQAIVVFIVPNGPASDDIQARAARAVTTRLGRYAAPERVYVVTDLPRTRSGKIVRRLLRKIASGDIEGFGDLSTLANPAAVTILIEAMRREASSA